MKKILMLYFLIVNGIYSQQRYLVNPNNEAIPLKHGEYALDAINNLEFESKLFAETCAVQQTVGYPRDKYPSNTGFNALPRDVLAMWFEAPATGTIDTIFWYQSGPINTLDSLVFIRVMKSNITPNRGPGDGIYPSPCTPWGHYLNSNDPINGISPFRSNATDTTWISTVSGSTPSFDLFGEEIFGEGIGLGVLTRPYRINHVAPEVVTGIPVVVTKGESFFITMRMNGLNQRLLDSTDQNNMTRFIASSANAPIPSRIWKFYQYRNGPSCPCGEPPMPYGWFARGGLNGKNDALVWNWWFTMTVTGDLPPQILSFDKLSDTTSIDPRVVNANIIDCYPSHPESIGVEFVKIFYNVNNSVYDSTYMYNSSSDVWTGTIPSSKPGSVVSYYITAIDINGNSTSSPLQTYNISSLSSLYYSIDTTTTTDWINLDTSRTTISSWMNYYAGVAPQDDGTAGPIDIGGAFSYFGTDVRYAWIGVNGGISLTSTQDEFVNVNINPYSNPLNNLIPSINIPKNFIGAFYNDYMLLPQPYYGVAHGSASYRVDGQKFIVAWDSVGLITDSSVTTNEFEIILDRSDNSISFVYKNVDPDLLGYTSLVGLQAEPQKKWMFVNANGRPLSLQPKSDRTLKFVPNISHTVNEGWNLLSLPTFYIDTRKTILFEDATSDAFTYHGNYVKTEVIPNGTACWLKYSSQKEILFPGIKKLRDSISVDQGWNMIGSIGVPILVTSIQCTPTDLVTSSFFGYSNINNKYEIVDTIKPGSGYWVKVSQAGKLILSLAPSNHSLTNIIIQPTSEIPPPPPMVSDAMVSLPNEYALAQAYPNPFNPATTIKYQLPVDSKVVLKIYNILGQVVFTIEDEVQMTGFKSVTWNATDVASGIYFYRLGATSIADPSKSFTQVKKMLLLK